MRTGKTRLKFALLIILILCLGGIILNAQVPVEVGRRDWGSLMPDGEGKGLLLGTCTQCHSMNHVVFQRKDAKGWEDTMHDMIMRGAQVKADEIAPMVEYLAEHFGPGAPPLDQSAAAPIPIKVSAASPGQPVTAASLPEGEGKNIILRSCVSCHAVNRITDTRKDKPGWETCVRDMVRLGARLRPKEDESLVTYLVKHFGR